MVCTSNSTAVASKPDMAPPIACHLHDYIEIACLYGLEIELVLKDGSHLRGQAKTTLTVQRKEYLLLIEHGKETPVALDQLQRMKALLKNPYFSEIVF